MRYNQDEVRGVRIDKLGNKINLYWNNHKTTQEELEHFKIWIDTLCEIHNIDKTKDGITDGEIQKVEEKLGIVLPPELKLLYETIGRNECFFNSSKIDKDKLLHLDELYVMENKLVFRKKNKFLFAVDLEKDRLVHYNKEWYWDKNEVSLTQCICISIYVNAIFHMTNTTYCKYKKEQVNGERYKETEKPFEEFFTQLPKFKYYENVLLVNKAQKALAWCRTNGIISHIFIGSDKQAFIESFSNKYKTKLNFKRTNGELL